MLKNYFKIALRNITKQKLYSLINIVGLTLGITCCILIYLFIQDEFSYDRFHEKADNIYRIEEIQYSKAKLQIKNRPFFDTRSPEGLNKSPWLPLALGLELKEHFPEVKNIVRIDDSSLLVRNGDKSFEQSIFFVEPTFFQMFSFKLIEGSPETVLNDPSNVVLTPEASQKYFGNEDPMGKSLTIIIRDEEKLFTVAGIAESVPKNSSISFEFLVNIQSKPYYEFNLKNWNSFNTPLFVELIPNANLDQFHDKLDSIVKEKYSEDWAEAREYYTLPENAPVMEFRAFPLKGIHLDASSRWLNSSNSLYSYILGAISVLILLVACINYITLALARSSGRAKEVGVRKASGALPNQIAIQFWGETQLLTIMALVAGTCLAELLLPFFNTIADKSLSIGYFENAGLLISLMGITLVVGLIAGSYPALVLSRYQPVKVLKGLTTIGFKPRLTKGLLVVQYSLSIFLIISSVIMFKQLDYVSSKDLGFNEEQVLFVPTHTGWNETGTNLMELYRTQLNGVSGIKEVSGMAPAFTRGTNRYSFKVGEQNVASYIYYVDEQIIPTLGMELISGRNFSSDRISDETESIIVNEALVKDLEWENPIGELLPWNDEENPSTVIGVVKDFHFQSLESEIQPMLFHMNPEEGGIGYIAIKLEEGMIGETLPELEAVWANVAPFTPFDFFFLDDAVASQYEDQQKWLQIMGASTFVAILIACLGLFGLAGLTAINKTKEIGIRKVLGAGVNQIVLLLNKDIVLLIVISMVIATPTSWYIMEQWLSDFSYRIKISVDIFVISTISALLLAIITVSYHSVKAALANPVDSLKSE